MKKYNFILVDSDNHEIVKKSDNFNTISKEWKKYNYNRRGDKYCDRWGTVKELVNGEYREVCREWLVR